MTDDLLSTTFSALADPTRRAILARLSEGEATVGELAAPFDMTFAAVSKHLRVLERAGLVVAHKAGREVRFAVRSEPLDATAAWMAGLASQWDDRLAAIKRIAES